MTPQEELDQLYIKARQVASDFIGYPCDEEDAKLIREATPMQAIKALEIRLQELLKYHHKEILDVATTK